MIRASERLRGFFGRLLSGRGLLLWLVLVGLTGEAIAQKRSGLGVEFAEWGFDDRAVPRKFNLLTLEIQNNSPNPFDGTISVSRLLSGTASGAPLVQRTYIGAYQKRLVQFTPYVFDFSDEWEVRWGPTLDETETIEAPRLGAGSRVIFNDPAQSSGLASGLRGFRDDRFPKDVIGTDTLLCVVLDHAPRWETVRRKVFRDWLYRGGVLHVLYGPEGRFPKLPVPELNSAERPTRFGTGRIYWHEFQRGKLHDNRPFVYDEIYPTATVPVPIRVNINEIFDSSAAEGFDEENADPTSTEFTTKLGSNSYTFASSEWDSDMAIPFALRDVVQAQTEHNWPLIYVLALAYLLLIFPGGPWLAKKLDYRLNLLALVVVVASWCWFYSAVGARGYGERSTTQSLAIARPLPDGRWDVTQWSGVFVTDGDTFPLTHQGETRHYSALVKDGERVEGYIQEGRDGRFVVDVPPFTSRTMAHRSVVEMPGPQITVTGAKWNASGALEELTLDLGESVPAGIQSAVLLSEGVIHELEPKRISRQTTLTLRGTARVAQQLIELNQNSYDYGFRYRRRESEERSYSRLFTSMVARDIGIRMQQDLSRFRFPRDMARLCLYAELPDELACRDGRQPDETLGFQNGRVLYSIDIPLSPPERPAVVNPNRPVQNVANPG